MAGTEYYGSTGTPVTGSQGASATMRAEFNLIQAAFDKLPTLVGNASNAVFVNSVGTAIEAVTAATARARLGLAVGSNVQAWDALLDALSALVTSADTLAYFTGSNTVSLTTLSAFIRTLLPSANAAAARTVLGAVSNDGSVPITGPQTIAGALTMGLNSTVKGNGATFGGQLILEKAVTGSTLSGNLTLQQAANSFSIFESAGALRGVFFDLSKAVGGVSSDGNFIIAQSLGNPGYVHYSNGFKIQWGNITPAIDVVNGTTQTFLFPISFTSSRSYPQLTIVANNPSDATVVVNAINDLSLTQLTVMYGEFAPNAQSLFTQYLVWGV